MFKFDTAAGEFRALCRAGSDSWKRCTLRCARLEFSAHMPSCLMKPPRTAQLSPLASLPLHTSTCMSQYYSHGGHGLNNDRFSARIDPAIDGHCNTVVQEDSVPMPYDVNNPPANNPYGVGYVVEKTPIKVSGFADAKPEANRVFKIINPNKLNPISGESPVFARNILTSERSACRLQACPTPFAAYARSQRLCCPCKSGVRGPPYLGYGASGRRAFLWFVEYCFILGGLM